MYRIKEAIKVAGELEGAAKDLPRSTVNRWSREGIISQVVDYETTEGKGGQSGLYPDDLPVEIAVAAKMKNKFKLDLVAKARKRVKKVLKEKLGNKYLAYLLPEKPVPGDRGSQKGIIDLLVVFSLREEYTQQEKDFLLKAADCDDYRQRDHYVDKYHEARQMAKIIGNYINLYSRYIEKMNRKGV